MAKQHRTGRERTQVALFLLRIGDFLKQMDVAFVRRLAVQRRRPQHRITGCFQHHGFADVVETEAAEFLWHVDG